MDREGSVILLKLFRRGPDREARKRAREERKSARLVEEQEAEAALERDYANDRESLDRFRPKRVIRLLGDKRTFHPPSLKEGTYDGD
jgi:hypothetical protein